MNLRVLNVQSTMDKLDANLEVLMQKSVLMEKCFKSFCMEDDRYLFYLLFDKNLEITTYWHFNTRGLTTKHNVPWGYNSLFKLLNIVTIIARPSTEEYASFYTVEPNIYKHTWKSKKKLITLS